MKSKISGLLLAAVALVAIAFAKSLNAAEERGDTGAESRIRARLHFLADDLLEGRGAGSRGYEIAARYVASQYGSFGLVPAGSSNTWFQAVPLMESRLVKGSAQMSFFNDGQEVTLEEKVDFVMGPDKMRATTDIRAPLAFIGFGVSAPNLDYDDYAGIDVKGRILLVLSGAPARFPNSERAYHSDNDRKWKLAAARGAVGIISVATPTDERRFPWVTIIRYVEFPSMDWTTEAGLPGTWFPELIGSARLSRAGAEKLLDAAGVKLGDLFENSAKAIPQSKLLPIEVRLSRRSEHRPVVSPNVIGLLRGSDPKLSNEFVVCTAHLDAIGITAPIEGDSINNGAFDNGMGISIMLETARSLAAKASQLKRSILFVAVTAEEKGLLGSEYFASHPTVPTDKMVANVNIDMPLLMFPPGNVVAFGAEHSSLGSNAARAAEAVGLELTPDPNPAQVTFIRSDHYSFVKQGVPALYLSPGNKSTDPSLDGAELQQEFRSNFYHRPNDDLRQTFNFAGAAKLARMNAALIESIANDPSRPSWNEGNFFGDTFTRKKVAR